MSVIIYEMDLIERLPRYMRYEVTITLKPCMYKFSAKDQWEKTRESIREVFETYSCTVIAELTSANNIHYHGMVELKDFQHRDRLLNRIRRFHKSLGKYTCTQLVHEPKWREYLRKSQDQTRAIIGIDPFIRDYFGLGEITDNTRIRTNEIDDIEMSPS